MLRLALLAALIFVGSSVADDAATYAISIPPSGETSEPQKNTPDVINLPKARPNSHIPYWWTKSSYENAVSLALFFDREAKRYQVYREGHVTQSERAFRMYYDVARGPNVKTICEVGFNAGHSAAIFLVANPHARVVSFDLGQYPYSTGNALLMKEIFGDRFEIVLGNSQDSILMVEKLIPGLTCDVISIDGEHTTEAALADLKNLFRHASCRNWILFDDPGYKSTNLAWQQAKNEGIVTQVDCFIETEPRLSSWQFVEAAQHRSWCLGFYNVNKRDPSQAKLTRRSFDPTAELDGSVNEPENDQKCQWFDTPKPSPETKLMQIPPEWYV